jgi:hypothetical protein
MNVGNGEQQFSGKVHIEGVSQCCYFTLCSPVSCLEYKKMQYQANMAVRICREHVAIGDVQNISNFVLKYILKCPRTKTRCQSGATNLRHPPL